MMHNMLTQFKSARWVLLAAIPLASSCHKKYDAGEYAPLYVLNGYSSVSEIAPDNLIAHWDFENDLVENVSGTAAAGTNTGFADGYVGKALQGSANGFAVADISSQIAKVNGSFSVSLWTYYPRTTGTDDNWVNIVAITNPAHYQSWNAPFCGNFNFLKYPGSDRTNGAPSHFGYHVRSVSGTGNWWDGPEHWFNNLWTASVYDNWVNWTFTYDAGNKRFNIYKDGAQWKSDGWLDPAGGNTYPQVLGNFSNLQFNDPPTKIIFGGNTDTGVTSDLTWGKSNKGYDGKLDEVRIYNTALTQPQIQAMIGLQGKGKL
ncbi:hypothetical protein [Flaviaesturariibacter amylovorans]|uniref:LamG domain-containing protein n=1 Tax=Flaviaesturariibacter amylovorans TaxID=1084520 RepID=A0ABP8H077_9BACT